MKVRILFLCLFLLLFIGCDTSSPWLCNEYPHTVEVHLAVSGGKEEREIWSIPPHERSTRLGQGDVIPLTMLNIFTNGQLLASYTEGDFQHKISSNKNGTVWVLTESGLLLLTERELKAMQKTSVMK